MRFYAETFAISVVAGALYAVCWWAQGQLDFGNHHITAVTLGMSYGIGLGVGLFIGHVRAGTTTHEGDTP